MPDPRCQRERRSERDRARRSPRCCSCRGTRRRKPRRPHGGHRDAQALHGRGLRPAHGAGSRAGGSRRAHGVLVAPGPDLLYFTGYEPIAITERITMLVLQASREPAMIVPGARATRRRGVAGSLGAVGRRLVGRRRPVRRDGRAARPERQVRDLRLGVGDARAWPAAVLPESEYVSMTSALPMLRAVKDADELERLAAAGAAADASFEQIRQVRFAGRPESEVAAELAGFSASMAIRRSTSPSSARARTAPTPTTSSASV